jgi:hypothetical protein
MKLTVIERRLSPMTLTDDFTLAVVVADLSQEDVEVLWAEWLDSCGDTPPEADSEFNDFLHKKGFLLVEEFNVTYIDT